MVRLVLARAADQRTFEVGYYRGDTPLDAFGALYERYCRRPVGDPQHLEDWWETATGMPLGLLQQIHDNAPPQERGTALADILRDGGP